MKLVIQIPCLDEAGTLPLTLADLPREMAGFSAVSWLVVDDGPRDSTRPVARAHGADRVAALPAQGGLAWVDVATNAPTRPSRLAASPGTYVPRATPEILARPVA